MDVVHASERDNTLQLGPTLKGRAVAALERMVLVIPVVVLLGGLFYLPDYLGRYREQEPMPGFLLGVLVVLAVFLGLIAALVRFVRSELWIIDLGEGTLVYQTRRLLGRGVEQTGIELDSVERFRLEKGAGLGSSGLFVDIDNGVTERIFEARFGADSFEKAADNLQTFCEDHDLGVVVEVER